MTKPIINISELEFGPFPAPMPESVKAKFETVVPSGKRAFPLHNHHVNEEMFFILEGEGEVRIGDKTYPIKKGDFIAHPPGGPETAHQIVNTSEKELRYLAVSTMQTPEIADYPDSKKFGVLSADGFRFLGRVSYHVKAKTPDSINKLLEPVQRPDVEPQQKCNDNQARPPSSSRANPIHGLLTRPVWQ